MTSCLRVVLPAVLGATLCGCIPRVVAPDYWDRRDRPAPPGVARPRAEPGFTSPDAAPPAPADEGAPRPVDIPASATAAVPRQPAPAWVARKVVPDARTVRDGTYVVQPGDTLRAAGAHTGVGAEALARANGLDTATAELRAGQRLRVPGGRYHLVRQGDTGVGIALAYGVPWSEVATANDLQPPYLLRTGQRLLLPPAAEVARRPMEERAQAFDLDIDDLVTGSAPAIAQRDAPARPTSSPARPAPASKPVATPPRFVGRFDWPLTGRILSRFGPGAAGRRNDGINIAAERGAPIRAAADGVVAYAGTDIAVYGGLILLTHGEGWITAYGHAQQILVTRGQAVKRGDVIARAGATGQVDQPQLHFEIRTKRTPVDPLRILPPRG